MVKKITLFLLLLFNLSAIDFAQLVPGNETQVNFSGYFDSFNVSVIYPSISVTKKVSESTSLTARYLVDMITAASIKNGKSNSNTTNTSISKVDAVTAASGRTSGGAGSRYQSEDILPKFDEVRHEFLKFSSLILPATAVIGTINPFTKKIFAAEKNNDSFSLSVITDQPSRTIHLIEQAIKNSKYGKDELQFTEYSLSGRHIGDIAYVKSQSLIDYHKATDEFSQSLSESANSLSLPKLMDDPVLLRFSSNQTLLEPDKINIFRGEALVNQLSLNNDLEHFRVEGLKGHVDVQVKYKSVKIISATCKHKTCMNMEPISKPGQNLICIPNQISLTIAGKNRLGVDSITF